MDDSGQDAGGLLAGIRRIVRSVFDLAHSRLEMFLIEIKEERIRLLEALALAVVFVLCTLMALLLVTFSVVIIFWEHRILVAVLLTAFYAGIAVVTFLNLRQRMRNWRSFAATLEQFKKDRECLENQN